MRISLYDELNGNAELSVEGMAKLAPLHLSLEERVPGVAGEAFDLKTWYSAWQKQRSSHTTTEPACMTVEAVDEFQATIPWNQLDQAVFLYRQNGAPLGKGFPIRLYVPDGSSECLNVKSVVKIRFVYDKVSDKATYGFKNQISTDDLKSRK